LLVLAEIFFDPEDGGDMFLRNVGCISTDYSVTSQKMILFSFKFTVNIGQQLSENESTINLGMADQAET
jgi:hypothetical protein